MQNVKARSKEHKRYGAYIKSLNTDAGIVEAVTAVMGNVDLGLDVITNGAFTKTIAERGNKIRVLDNHQTGSVTNVIGKVLSLREVSRDQLPSDVIRDYPDATGGLYVRTQFAVNESEAARTAFNLIKSGYVDEWSIGYDVIESDYTERNGKRVRLLKRIKLWECSPVVFAANPATTTTSAKARNDDTEKRRKDMLAQIEAAQSEDDIEAMRVQMLGAVKAAMSDLFEQQAIRSEGDVKMAMAKPLARGGGRTAEQQEREATTLSDRLEMISFLKDAFNKNSWPELAATYANEQTRLIEFGNWHADQCDKIFNIVVGVDLGEKRKNLPGCTTEQKRRYELVLKAYNTSRNMAGSALERHLDLFVQQLEAQEERRQREFGRRRSSFIKDLQENREQYIDATEEARRVREWEARQPDCEAVYTERHAQEIADSVERRYQPMHDRQQAAAAEYETFVRLREKVLKSAKDGWCQRQMLEKWNMDYATGRQSLSLLGSWIRECAMQGWIEPDKVPMPGAKGWADWLRDATRAVAQKLGGSK